MTSEMHLEVIRGDEPAVVLTYDKLDFRLGTDNQLAEVFTVLARTGKFGLPGLQGISFNEISRRAPDVLPYIHVLRVSDQPATFEFMQLGFGTKMDGGNRPRFFGELVPHLGPKLWSSLAEIYADAAFRGRVSLSEVHASAGGDWFAYRRLVMPLSSNGRDIDQVLCAVVHETVEFDGLLPGDFRGIDVDHEEPLFLSRRPELIPRQS
tara:strand:- start:1257 stop:1880 length:624 start_codon:yes stop_codon:yes gene_type:complete